MKQIRSNELLEEFYKEYNINEFDLSDLDLFLKFIDDNTEKIKNMTEEEFIKFFKEDNEVFRFCDEVKYFIETKKEI